MLGLTVGAALLSVLAFAIPASARSTLTLWAAVLISAGIVAGAVVLVHVPFVVGWARAQSRRACSYEGLVRRLDEASAEVVLLKGLRSLRVIRLDRDVAGRGTEMILDVGPLNGVAEGEWLVVLDTVVRKRVGRARVARFHAGRCFADFTPSDPVLDGYLREHGSAPHPEGIVAFRELDLQAGDQRLQQLLAEAEPWQ